MRRLRVLVHPRRPGGPVLLRDLRWHPERVLAHVRRAAARPLGQPYRGGGPVAGGGSEIRPAGEPGRRRSMDRPGSKDYGGAVIVGDHPYPASRPSCQWCAAANQNYKATPAPGRATPAARRETRTSRPVPRPVAPNNSTSPGTRTADHRNHAPIRDTTTTPSRPTAALAGS